MVNSSYFIGLSVHGRLVVEEQDAETIAVEVFWKMDCLGTAVARRRGGKMVRLLKWDRPGVLDKLTLALEAGREDVEREIIYLADIEVPEGTDGKDADVLYLAER